MKALILLTCVLVLAEGCQAPARAETPLPRYHYTPGEVLDYEGQSTFTYQTGKFTYTTSEKTWVVAQNSDGSWVLLTRSQTTMHREDKNNPGEADDKQTFWTRATTLPDGSESKVETSDAYATMRTDNYRLPANAKELKSGWEAKDDSSDVRYNVASVSGDGQIVIHSVTSTFYDPIDLCSHSSDTTFDPARGLRVSEVEHETQGYGFVGQETGTTTLKSVATETPERLKQLNDEFTAYMVAQNSTKGLISSDSTPDQVDAGTKAESAIYEKLRAAVPDFTDLVDGELAGLKPGPGLDYDKKEARERQDLLHAPASAWTATDLKGAPHALADYRGRVVVLDFWYRGCGWCMLAMPQVIDAAAHFAGQPVTFLAMTTDNPKTKDADFVVDKMKIPYPVLHAGKVADGYNIRGFPTLLVLDPKGVVRFIHICYAKDLRDQIEANVESLLVQGK